MKVTSHVGWLIEDVSLLANIQFVLECAARGNAEQLCAAETLGAFRALRIGTVYREVSPQAINAELVSKDEGVA